MEKKSNSTILLSILIALGAALFLYFLLIHFVVDVNLQKNQREIALLDFYNTPHDNEIFVIGSSMVNEGIDAYLIENASSAFINRSIFVLGLDAETPLSKVPELNNLIASRPGMVVIGISYRDLVNQSNIYDDRFTLISQRITCGAECRQLFNESQLKLISQNPLEQLIFKRKFLYASLISQGKELLRDENKTHRSYLRTTNFKDPWIHEINKTDSEKIEMLGNASSFPVAEDPNPQKTALALTINLLKKNNISVIIINMPLNPYQSGIINDTTRKNFSTFLNATGVPWYDYEREYPSEYFTDFSHLNVAGRTDFSPRIAARIEENLQQGA